jgi:hypothetical protein
LGAGGGSLVIANDLLEVGDLGLSNGGLCCGLGQRKGGKSQKGEQKQQFECATTHRDPFPITCPGRDMQCGGLPAAIPGECTGSQRPSFPRLLREQEFNERNQMRKGTGPLKDDMGSTFS